MPERTSFVCTLSLDLSRGTMNASLQKPDYEGKIKNALKGRRWRCKGELLSTLSTNSHELYELRMAINSLLSSGELVSSTKDPSLIRKGVQAKKEAA